MVKTLQIKNFKSIKQLKLDCKRINIFIGEPNSGKSNILEAVGIFSLEYYWHPYKLKDFVRFERTSQIFYDENLDEEIQISFDDKVLKVGFKGGTFRGQWTENGSKTAVFSGGFDNVSIGGDTAGLQPFKFYRFAIRESFGRPESDFLLPPYGDNLLSLLLTHRDIRATANQLFSPFGLRLNLRPQENKIEVIKLMEDVTISYPYSLASDTLQRLIFHLAAILSNKDSILAFEEPEAHAFPYHTKYLAETIALDENNNQYFISTHNPYFLLPVVEKSPKEDIAVFITYFEDYQTKVELLSDEKMEELTEVDIFSNLERFLER